MENKKMSCWDFVFSSVKTHIDDLVRQADKYTKDMNEDFEHFFCWYAEDMYKTQRELSCYRALKVVLSAGSHDDVKLYMESKINSPVSYTHLRAHETDSYLVCRLLLEKKKKKNKYTYPNPRDRQK